MKEVQLKGSGTVSDSEAQRNVDLLAEVAQRLSALTTKEQAQAVFDEAWTLGETRSQMSGNREKLISDLRKAIAGEDVDG